MGRSCRLHGKLGFLARIKLTKEDLGERSMLEELFSTKDIRLEDSPNASNSRTPRLRVTPLKFRHPLFISFMRLSSFLPSETVLKFNIILGAWVFPGILRNAIPFSHPNPGRTTETIKAFYSFSSTKQKQHFFESAVLSKNFTISAYCFQN
jgi:hypothetical protein